MRLLFTFIYILICFTTDCIGKEFCIIIDDTITLKEDYYEQAKTIYKFDSRSFGKAYDILDKSKGYIKINYQKNSYGWFKPKPILSQKNKFSDILLNMNNLRFILAKKQDQLTRKAIIVNQISDNKSITEVPIYANSLLNGEPIGKITIFELRYIFAETEKSVLIAKNDRIVKSNSSLRITGWIDKKYLYEWNTRIGVEFNKNNYSKRKESLGQIFYKETHIMQFLDGNSNINPLSVEESTKKPMPYYANRFPLLKVKTHNGHKYYNIAYIGGATSKGKFISKESIELEKNKLEEILQEKTLKIAILIDATKGMGEHIDNVRQALIEFLPYIHSKKDNTLSAKVAICVYRDYSDSIHMFEILNTFTNKLDVLKNSLNTITTKSNPNDNGLGTYPEALFHGIYQTIHNNQYNQAHQAHHEYANNKFLDWKSSKAEKFIILIGDHGNHEDYSQYPADKKYNEIKIRNILDHNRMSLYAVQVNIAPINTLMHQYNKMFEKQVYRIIDNNSVFGKLYKVTENSQEKILNVLKEILINRLNLDKICYSAREGTLDIDGYRGPFVQKVLKRYGINPEIFKAVQGCSLAYVSKHNENGLVQLQEKVLIERREINKLKEQMSDMAGELVYFNPRESKKTELMKIFKRIVRNLTNDEPDPGENIAEFIERKTGIPIQTKWLDQSIEELTHIMYHSDEQRDILNRELKEKVLKLEEVLNEKKLVNISWNDEDKTFNWDKGEQEIQYFFSLEQPIPEREKGDIASKKTSAWLPIEYFP